MKNIKKLQALAVTGLVVALAVGCGGGGSSDGGGAAESGEEVRVTATLPFIADMTREVGGESVEVSSILQPGDEVHTFQPSPSTARTISDSQIVFQNGHGLESWLDDLVQSAGGGQTNVVELSEGLEPVEGGGHEEGAHGEEGEHAEGEHAGESGGHEHGAVNPHFWLSAPNAEHYVEGIRDALIEADPQNAETYRANAEEYLGELEELDGYITEQVETIPEENRKLVTFHDAFPYFAEEYGFELTGVVVQNPNAEASSGEVADLIRTVREENVPAIFTEPQFNSGLADTIAREAGVEVYPLYATFAEEGEIVEEDISSYEQMMRTNVDNMVEGLG